MRLFAGTKYDQPPKCERCNRPAIECICPSGVASYLPPASQTARISLEKRSKGKQVTIIRGLIAKHNDLPNLLTRLKSLCGAGGTIQDDCLEVQGDHLAKIRETLRDLGYQLRP